MASPTRSRCAHFLSQSAEVLDRKEREAAKGDAPAFFFGCFQGYLKRRMAGQTLATREHDHDYFLSQSSGLLSRLDC